MKTYLKVSFILFLAIGILGCNNSTPEVLDLEQDFKLVNVKNQFTLKVPNYMSESKELHVGASLQQINKRKETYVMAIDEDKENFIYALRELNSYNDSWSTLENYANTSLLAIHERTNLPIGEPKKTIINGKNAQLYFTEGHIDGISADISYILAYIEGNKKIYSITVWTLKSRMKRYKSTFFQIIKSFEELDKN